LFWAFFDRAAEQNRNSWRLTGEKRAVVAALIDRRDDGGGQLRGGPIAMARQLVGESASVSSRWSRARSQAGFRVSFDESLRFAWRLAPSA